MSRSKSIFTVVAQVRGRIEALWRPETSTSIARSLDEFQTRMPESVVLVVSGSEQDRTRASFGAFGAAFASSESRATQPSGPPPPMVMPVVAGYEILSVLGRGGMGVVYKARSIRLGRIVALKMILWGDHSTSDVVLRLLSEAESAARLQHPNIVQIYHVGDSGGLPFLELEYLEGGSLDRKLDGSPWLASRAASLIETLAGAVAAAHRAGIIHRDLKPGNILLDIDGTPKVGDFGLARRLGAGHDLTGTGAVLGTPAYMAPEQAEGKARDVGPQADVHALGAMLYELLTGRTPFRGATVYQTLEFVRTAEPVSPSRLVASIPRDLVTICLKALQKDPARRYPTATDLGDDLRRYLDGRPIQARSSTSIERAWRWCRRNPAIAALILGIASLMILGLVSATIAAFRFRQLAEKAELARFAAESSSREARYSEQAALKAQARSVDEARRARQTAEFLGKLFEEADPVALDSLAFGDRGRAGLALTARDILDRGATRLAGQFDDPELRVTLLEAVGNAYLGLGEVDKAEPALAEALAIRKKVKGPEDAFLAATLHSLAYARLLKGDGEEAVRVFREALRLRRQVLEPDDLRLANTMLCLAMSIHQSEIEGTIPEARSLLDEALAIQKKKAGPRSREFATTSMIKAFFRLNEGKSMSVLPDVLEAASIIEEVEGKKGLGQAISGFLMGRAQDEIGLYRLSAENYTRAVGELLRILGPRHPVVGFGRYYQGKALLHAQLLDRAVVAMDQALLIFRGCLGESHPAIAIVLIEKARTVRDQKDFPRAEAILNEAIAIGHKNGHARASELSRALFIYASLLARRDADLEAIQAQREVLQLDLIGGFSTEVYATAKLGFFTGCIEQRRGATAEDVQLLRQAIDSRRKRRKEGDPDNAMDLILMGRALDAQGQAKEAKEVYRQSLALFPKVESSMTKDQKGARDLARSKVGAN